jgi:PAS domain S-box-containing protein
MIKPDDRAGEAAAFLRGGGATGALIATRDWSSTPLGPLAAWPQSLKTALALVLNSPVAMVLRWGEAGLMLYNDAYAELAGDRHPQLLGAAVRDISPVIPQMDEAAQQAVLGGARLHYADQMRTVLRGGRAEELWLNIDYTPVRDESGEIAGVLGILVDITGRVLAERAQAATQESERRLSAALSLASLGAFEWDLKSRDAKFDARAREIFGFSPDDTVTVDAAFARINRNDVARIKAEARTDISSGRTRYSRQFRVHLPDGTVRQVVSISDVTLGPRGEPIRTVGVFDDVTARRSAEHRQRLLINELNHRVKNSLATVQSIAAQTLRTAADLTSARNAFEARLVALAATHDVLTAESWHGARLADVAASALAPFEATSRPQIDRSGPAVWLTAQRALALSLALHELATNAAKYGALSVPEGKVTIRWSQTAEDELTLTWTEQGGPEVSAPDRTGFGTRLLERNLPRELDAEVALTFAPEGLRCVIRFKVASGRFSVTGPKEELASLPNLGAALS